MRKREKVSSTVSAPLRVQCTPLQHADSCAPARCRADAARRSRAEAAGPRRAGALAAGAIRGEATGPSRGRLLRRAPRPLAPRGAAALRPKQGPWLGDRARSDGGSSRRDGLRVRLGAGAGGPRRPSGPGGAPARGRSGCRRAALFAAEGTAPGASHSAGGAPPQSAPPRSGRPPVDRTASAKTNDCQPKSSGRGPQLRSTPASRSTRAPKEDFGIRRRPQHTPVRSPPRRGRPLDFATLVLSK